MLCHRAHANAEREQANKITDVKDDGWRSSTTQLTIPVFEGCRGTDLFLSLHDLLYCGYDVFRTKPVFLK